MAKIAWEHGYLTCASESAWKSKFIFHFHLWGEKFKNSNIWKDGVTAISELENEGWEIVSVTGRNEILLQRPVNETLWKPWEHKILEGFQEGFVLNDLYTDIPSQPMTLWMDKSLAIVDLGFDGWQVAGYTEGNIIFKRHKEDS